MISWLCFVKGSLYVMKTKIQTHIVEKYVNNIKKVKGVHYEKLLKRVALVILFLTICSNVYTGSAIVHAQPPYAKWGKLAVEKRKNNTQKQRLLITFI